MYTKHILYGDMISSYTIIHNTIVNVIRLYTHTQYYTYIYYIYMYYTFNRMYNKYVQHYNTIVALRGRVLRGRVKVGSVGALGVPTL